VEEPVLSMTEESNSIQVEHLEFIYTVYINIHYEGMFIRNVFLQVGVSKHFLLADLL
jgi:hypothetical protein